MKTCTPPRKFCTFARDEWWVDFSIIGRNCLPKIAQKPFLSFNKPWNPLQLVCPWMSGSSVHIQLLDLFLHRDDPHNGLLLNFEIGSNHPPHINTISCIITKLDIWMLCQLALMSLQHTSTYSRTGSKFILQNDSHSNHSLGIRRCNCAFSKI